MADLGVGWPRASFLCVKLKGMKIEHSLAKSVRVANQEFQWHVQRRTQWCSSDGWKGLALHLELAHEPQRALILEFPFRVVSHHSCPHRQRPSVTEKDVEAAIAAALAAGWKPESRGKVFVFEVTETEAR